MFGLSPGAFSGSTKDLLGRVHPDDRRRAAEAFALEDGRIDVELRFVRGGGVDVWLELRARTIRSLSDDLTRVVGVLVDVTQVRDEARVDRQELAQIIQQHSLLSAVIEQMPTGVIIAEAPSGRILLSNAQFDQMWGEPLRRASDFSEYREFRGFHPDGTPYKPEDWPLA